MAMTDALIFLAKIVLGLLVIYGMFPLFLMVSVKGIVIGYYRGVSFCARFPGSTTSRLEGGSTDE